MSQWADTEARKLVQEIGALIIFGQTRTDAVYQVLSRALDEAYTLGSSDNMKKELKP